MTPQSFDNETCAELLGDTRKRSIEAKIELTAYQKRLDRIARMSVANGVAA